MNLVCKLCSSQPFSSVVSFVSHFELTHKASNQSRFPCGFENCFISSQNLVCYRQHVSEFHLSQLESDLSCNLPAPGKIHRCGFVGCTYTCSSSGTLRVHRKRKYHHVEESCDLSSGSNSSDHVNVTDYGSDLVSVHDSNEMELEPLDSPISSDQMCSIDVAAGISSESSEDTGGSLMARREQVEKKFTHFYLTLCSKFHTPESTVQYMIDTHHSLDTAAGNILTEELVEKLSKCEISASENIDSLKDSVREVVDNNVVAKVHDPKGALRSMYMRRKTYHNGKSYVPPVPFYLGRDKFNKKKYGHWVKVEVTLQQMFEDDSIYDQYLESGRSRGSKDGIIRDIHDGSLLMNHPILSEDPSAIGIMLYQDDLELANALGSAKGQHKITAFYYTLSNLHPWSRMNIIIIRMALIVAEKDVVYFGLKKSIRPLTDHLKQLEETGITIRGKKCRVVPIMLLGDNLGTHMFIGLLENFSKSKYFCRYCEESREEWRERWYGNREVIESSDTDSDDSISDDEESSDSDSGRAMDEEEGEEPYVWQDNSDDVSNETSMNVQYITAPLRTPERYDDCLEKLKTRPEGANVKGIVAKCPLNKLKNFHCIGSSPPCLAHDLFEGVIAYDIALAINYFVSTNSSITIEYINRKIQALKLRGSDEGDRPAFVKANMQKLRGSAVQNRNFLRFLPLIVGKKMRLQDPVWKMVLQLIDVTRVLTSPGIARSYVPVLRQKIYCYLAMRVECFPGVPLRPKHHFLEHYPELILIFGCLMRVGTLSFESKHRFFKNTALAKKNFKNITRTLSEEHQLADSAQSVEHLTTPWPLVERASPFTHVTLCPSLKECLISFFGADFLNSSAVSEKVRFRGVWYCKGDAVVTAWKSERSAQLCLIELIIVNGKNCYISGEGSY